MPLKKFVDNSSNREICVFTAILVIGNVIVPTINIVFETEIENYMLLTQYVTYVLLGYIIGGLHGDDSDGIKNAISALSGGGLDWIVDACLCYKSYNTVSYCYGKWKRVSFNSGR